MAVSCDRIHRAHHHWPHLRLRQLPGRHLLHQEVQARQVAQGQRLLPLHDPLAINHLCELTIFHSFLDGVNHHNQ